MRRSMSVAVLSSPESSPKRSRTLTEPTEVAEPEQLKTHTESAVGLKEESQPAVSNDEKESQPAVSNDEKEKQPAVSNDEKENQPAVSNDEKENQPAVPNDEKENQPKEEEGELDDDVPPPLTRST